MQTCPRIVIAATGSGIGKTSVAVGLVAALRARGLRVQTFKTGPDFLDPSYLTAASGRPCYNLDGWMCGREYALSLFSRAVEDADIAVIEGAMGLFDGADADSLQGSTAEIAYWLDAPVVLAADASGAARSLAAVLYGFVHFEPGVRVCGCIANHCGTKGHVELLSRALESAGLPKLLGGLRAEALPILPSRHLGLLSVEVSPLSDETLQRFRDVTEACLSVDELIQLAGSAPFLERRVWPSEQGGAQVRIAVARDAAFHFYYPDNLQALEEAGAELAYFSPLQDAAIPPDCGGLYIGGGYPESYAAELSANQPMLRAIRDFAGAGRLVYAECGGLMYLSQGVELLDKQRHPLVGLLPKWTRMLARRKALGYVEAEPARDLILERAGVALRGHEFHYSEIVETYGAQDGWRPAYRIRTRRRTQEERLEGFHRGNILASYIHLHFASHPGAAARLVQLCREALRATK